MCLRELTEMTPPHRLEGGRGRGQNIKLPVISNWLVVPLRVRLRKKRRIFLPRGLAIPAEGILFVFQSLNNENL